MAADSSSAVPPHDLDEVDSPLNPLSCYSRVPLITQAVTAGNLPGSAGLFHLVLSKESLRSNITGRKQILRLVGIASIE